MPLVLQGRAVVQLLCDRTVYLRAEHQENHLSSDPNGHIFVTSNQLGWEMWKLEEVAGTVMSRGVCIATAELSLRWGQPPLYQLY